MTPREDVDNLARFFEPVSPNTAAMLRALLARAEQAEAARDDAIREMVAMARQAGAWQGIADGKDVVIRQIEAERDAARAEAARLREADDDWDDGAGKRINSLITKLEAARARIAELERERDASDEAIRRITQHGEDMQARLSLRVEELERSVEMLREAQSQALRDAEIDGRRSGAKAMREAAARKARTWPTGITTAGQEALEAAILALPQETHNETP